MSAIVPQSCGPLRNGKGQFLERGGPGRAKGSKETLLAKMEHVLRVKVRKSNMATVVAKLIELAESGEEWAVKEFLKVCGAYKAGEFMTAEMAEDADGNRVFRVKFEKQLD